jgi:hypothetical protein
MMVISLLAGIFTVLSGPLINLPWFLEVPLDLLALATGVILLATARESQAYYQRLVGLIYCGFGVFFTGFAISDSPYPNLHTLS